MYRRQFSLGWSITLAITAVVLVLETGASAAAVPPAKSATTFTTIYDFTGGSDGSIPADGLINDGKGNFYGITWSGGTNNTGTVFELSPDGKGGWLESVLYSFGVFGSGDCETPVEPPVFDGHGNIYGTTESGGTGNFGCVFELSPASGGGWTERVLYSFTGGADGNGPWGSLIMGEGGTLYGTAAFGGTNLGAGSQGGGTVWELSPNKDGSWKFKTLKLLRGKDGALPSAGLNRDRLGNLWGTTSAGGWHGNGVVFELRRTDRRHWKYEVVHTFKLKDGSHPQYGRLIFGKNGGVLGTTADGGANDNGTIFELEPSRKGGYVLSTLYHFGTYRSGDGRHPNGGLYLDKQDNLYGTTLFGGDLTCNGGGCGIVFELVRGTRGWMETVLHKFEWSDGAYVDSTLSPDGSGNLFGVAQGGGTYSHGTAFEITP
jgi:uncharacterized repeat protein (TIGR03803 family)